MGKVFAYLLMFGILFFCGWAGLVFYAQGDMTGALVGLGLLLSFATFFIFMTISTTKLTQQQDLNGQNYELVMTRLDHVESLGNDYYYVHTKWVDEDGGAEYFFKSGYVNFNPESFLKDKEIPVKISLEDYRDYAVDLSMLPQKA